MSIYWSMSWNFSCQKRYLVLIYKCLGKWGLYYKMRIISHALKTIAQTFEYLGVGSRSNTVFSLTKMEGRWKLTGWGTKQDSLWNRGENRGSGKKDIFQKYEVF